jgi:hypothetical protein
MKREKGQCGRGALSPPDWLISEAGCCAFPPEQRGARPEQTAMPRITAPHTGGNHMRKAALLWLIGVPLPVILLLWFFFR